MAGLKKRDVFLELRIDSGESIQINEGMVSNTPLGGKYYSGHKMLLNAMTKQDRDNLKLLMENYQLFYKTLHESLIEKFGKTNSTYTIEIRINKAIERI